MADAYSVNAIVHGLRQALHQYLEAQYHVWDEGIVIERLRLFESPGATYQEPWIEATPFYIGDRRYRDLRLLGSVKKFLEDISKFNVGVFETPYEHQAKAIELAVTDHSDVIIATGTGSGKTESFLMPILGQLVVESEVAPNSIKLSGCRAILLYPMNALVNDQVARLRRLIGSKNVADKLFEFRKRVVRFGMYTSRTPYAGPQTTKADKARLGPLFENLFKVSADIKRELEAKGKWPAKDMARFQAQGYATSQDDRELFTRHEMHKACPDVLITNYSMLEYMLLRPIEAPIFDQTREWLQSNNANVITIVLDEAHMYRGAAGAEVAMLLRRLQSRLGVDRSRLRFILTSASLGDSEEATTKMKAFAADLTGLRNHDKPFEVVRGTVDRLTVSGAPSKKEIEALAAIHLKALNEFAVDLVSAVQEVNRFLLKLGQQTVPKDVEEAGFRDAVFQSLTAIHAAPLLADFVTGKALPYRELLKKLFGEDELGEKALEGLVALCCIGRRKSDERVFLPLRLHMFFRGVGGIFACVDPECSARSPENSGEYLGRLYDTPRMHCECGSRVYELLTHRDCGAAFIRGYLRSDTSDFMWHEPTKVSVFPVDQLVESHFLVETARHRSKHGYTVWLHKRTGRIIRQRPNDNLDEFVSLIQGNGVTEERGRRAITFDKECPVCRKQLRSDSNKIMDLVTKGEAPFAHLVKNQVMFQPPTRPASQAFPNAGRKCLLFSDGRQKAARLARDIPREVERDVFRQVIVLAVEELNKIGRSERARPDTTLYTAVLHVLAKHNLQFFDGRAREELSEQVRQYRKYKDLADALDEAAFTRIPAEFKAHMLRQLCHSFYSLHALTIGTVEPVARALNEIKVSLPGINGDHVEELACAWVQYLLKEFALDIVPVGIRNSAAGYARNNWGEKPAFPSRQRKILEGLVPNLSLIETKIVETLGHNQSGVVFIEPAKVKIRLALDEKWWRCASCSYVSLRALMGRCQNCLDMSIRAVHPNDDEYLRARKTFWRDPVVRMVNGQDSPFAIAVEEHTAQLSYRDFDEPVSTTEEYERRFRDILVHTGDTPIDVLSSTTTMEVGIDIGSLVAVGLRNIPPMRQNYQQRAGRTGRRGSAVSSVLTYAQNNPHDSHYFGNPERIISGDPPLPAIDIKNERIIKRHIYAVLLQTYFHFHTVKSRVPKNIFSVLGDTWEFYNGDGDFTLDGLTTWLNSEHSESTFSAIGEWLPPGVELDAKVVAREFMETLQFIAPVSKEELDEKNGSLIEFLFTKGLLPSYAFPRDLCALQIERPPEKVAWGTRVSVLERPQQGLNIALGEYAPGRIIVVNKKSYRIGAVAAALPSSIPDKAARLFANMKRYFECPECSYTEPAALEAAVLKECPLCKGHLIRLLNVLQPEVVFPEEAQEIDELDDEEVRTVVTSARLPQVRSASTIHWESVFPNAQVASAENQLLVMMNKGEESPVGGTGFSVCDKCGKAVQPGMEPAGHHQRDYYVEWRVGQPKTAPCNGKFRSVVLGYSFTSDTILLRIQLKRPLITDVSAFSLRRPLDDALTSLAAALALAAAHFLDVDVRELNSGHRYIRVQDDTFAEIFLYDTLSGGAGYASLTAKRVREVMKEVFNSLSNCNCQSSCDKCLRHYGNRLVHESLDRFLALDLIAYIVEEHVPEIKSRDAQIKALGPLCAMLKLEGWDITEPKKGVIIANLGDQTRRLAVRPALIDPSCIDDPLLAEALVFSDYELQRNLPGAFAMVKPGSR